MISDVRQKPYLILNPAGKATRPAWQWSSPLISTTVLGKKERRKGISLWWKKQRRISGRQHSVRRLRRGNCGYVSVRIRNFLLFVSIRRRGDSPGMQSFHPLPFLRTGRKMFYRNGYRSVCNVGGDDRRCDESKGIQNDAAAGIRPSDYM